MVIANIIGTLTISKSLANDTVDHLNENPDLYRDQNGFRMSNKDV